MKVSILLPYKENYSPSYPGAVSIFVNSTNKFLNRHYGGGKKVVLKKGQLLTEKDKKKTYFKPNKKWEFND